MRIAQLIECALIDIPELDASSATARALDWPFVNNLAQAIGINGLLQPIVVRPNPGTDGHYLVVAGRHRFHAVRDVLKETAISCTVADDMDDQSALMSTFAENVFRFPLEKASHFAQLKAWTAWAESRGLIKKGGSGGDRKSSAAATNEAAEADDAIKFPNREFDSENTVEPHGIEKASGEKLPEPTKTAAQLYSEVSGKSKSAAYREIKVSDSFTPDQQEVFDQMGLSTRDRYEIAGIKDQVQKGVCVNLIAQGMDVDEAIRQSSLPLDAPVVPDENALSDQEWLETYCAEIRLLLKATPSTLARFDRDAIFYRITAQAREAVRKFTKKALATVRKIGGDKGPLIRLTNRYANLEHPRNWLTCGECKCSGAVAGRKCPACFGDGYTMLVSTPQK